MTIKEGVYSKATMRLRSQKNITAGAETPKSSRRQTSETPKQPRVKLPVAESPLQPQVTKDDVKKLMIAWMWSAVVSRYTVFVCV